MIIRLTLLNSAEKKIAFGFAGYEIYCIQLQTENTNYSYYEFSKYCTEVDVRIRKNSDSEFYFFMIKVLLAIFRDKESSNQLAFNGASIEPETTPD